MGMFSTILAKLGFGSDKVEAAEQPAAPAAPTATAAPAAPAVTAISDVDVVAKLEALAKANAEKLNWKVSIVDLLKLLDLDSSLQARAALGQELGVHAGADGSAEQNIALQKAVWAKLAENGGHVPATLRD